MINGVVNAVPCVYLTSTLTDPPQRVPWFFCWWEYDMKKWHYCLGRPQEWIDICIKWQCPFTLETYPVPSITLRPWKLPGFCFKVPFCFISMGNSYSLLEWLLLPLCTAYEFLHVFHIHIMYICLWFHICTNVYFSEILKYYMKHDIIHYSHVILINFGLFVLSLLDYCIIYRFLLKLISGEWESPHIFPDLCLRVKQVYLCNCSSILMPCLSTNQVHSYKYFYCEQSGQIVTILLQTLLVNPKLPHKSRVTWHSWLGCHMVHLLTTTGNYTVHFSPSDFVFDWGSFVWCYEYLGLSEH